MNDGDVALCGVGYRGFDGGGGPGTGEGRLISNIHGWMVLLFLGQVLSIGGGWSFMEGERIWRGRGKASGYDYCNAGYIVCMSFFFLPIDTLLSAQLNTRHST